MRSSVALVRISILMNAAANISLRLFPIHKVGFAGGEAFLPLAQNVFMPSRGLECLRIAAQVVPESLQGLELLFEGHLAKRERNRHEEIIPVDAPNRSSLLASIQTPPGAALQHFSTLRNGSGALLQRWGTVPGTWAAL
jgi:hypothetical protein